MNGRNPEEFLRAFVRPGMTVLEPGPGMGFFSLPLAKLVGPLGRVVAVDIQPKMLDNLRRRAAKAGLLSRIETRLARPDSLAIEDLATRVDFVLAYAVVHELPSTETFFREASSALKPRGTARSNSLDLDDLPKMRRNLAAFFTKASA